MDLNKMKMKTEIKTGIRRGNNLTQIMINGIKITWNKDEHK